MFPIELVVATIYLQIAPRRAGEAVFRLDRWASRTVAVPLAKLDELIVGEVTDSPETMGVGRRAGGP